MTSLSCYICLLPFESDDRHVRFMSEQDEISGQTLWKKLQLIGFFPVRNKHLEVGKSLYDMPSHLCSWCASRVEDAYDLKQQCLKVEEKIVSSMVNQSEKECVECALNENLLPLHSKEEIFLPQTMKSEILSGVPTTSTISLVASSACEMFSCLKNISFSLRVNSLLLANATQFLENIISLLAVLASLKEEGLGAKKSARAIRSEVDLWRMKSSIVSDAASFVRELMNSQGMVPIRDSRLFHGSSKSKQSSSSGPMCSEKNEDRISIVKSVVPEAVNSFQGSSSKICHEMDKMGSKDSAEIKKDQDVHDHNPSLNKSSSLRRSFRSKAKVDHLVYWPSFKKHGSNNSKTTSNIKQKSSKMLEQNLANSIQLDTNGISESTAETNNKLVLVRKRKSTDGNKNSEWTLKVKPRKIKSTHENKNSEWELKAKPQSSPSSLPVTKNSFLENFVSTDVEEKPIEIKKEENVKENSNNAISMTCSICGKMLSCNRSLQAHLNLHSGLSIHRCHYCSKLFTSGWNLAQHERVHTGLKPYICDVCKQSFRYNVTLRNHKIKQHSK